MSWAFGVPFGGPDPQSYLQLLQRLMPDGYSQDPDGPRVTELEAYATGLWVARTAIDRAVQQAFQSRTTELLEEWEHAYGLPNDAARSDEERRERLIAAELSTAGAAHERIEAALARVAPSAAAVASSRAQVDASAALDEMIYQIGVSLDLAEWSDPAVRRAVARILRRTLPARCLSVPGFRTTNGSSGPPDTEGPLFVSEGATWGGGEKLGRTVLRRQDGTTYAMREPTNRYREYAPLSKLTAADLNAIQDLTLMQGCNGDAVIDDYPTAGTDMAIVHVAQQVPATTEVLLDNSIDWRDRYVAPAFHHSTSDIRPGSAGDTTDLSAQSALTPLISTLDGDTTALTGDHLKFASAGAYLYARATDGALCAYNASASAIYIVGVFVASPDLGTR